MVQGLPNEQALDVEIIHVRQILSAIQDTVGDLQMRIRTHTRTHTQNLLTPGG